MTTARIALGQRGETLAARELERTGHRIIARNVRTPFGEIDIVARRGGELALVEVRTRRSDAYGSPEQSLDAAKRHRMRAAALWYVDQAGEMGDWSIDLVAVEVAAGGAVSRLEHVKALACD